MIPRGAAQAAEWVENGPSIFTEVVTMQGSADNLANSAGLLVLRVGVGGYMLTHGLGKVRMLVGGQAAALGDPVGLGNELSLALLILAEFVCAGLIVTGTATRLAAVPLVIAMGAAALVAHAQDPWTMEQAALRYMEGEAQSWASKEPALLFLFAFLALALTGAGAFSVDALIQRRLSKPSAAGEDDRGAPIAAGVAQVGDPGVP